MERIGAFVKRSHPSLKINDATITEYGYIPNNERLQYVRRPRRGLLVESRDIKTRLICHNINEIGPVLSAIST
ncbi:hypothetical protein L9F63_000394, partial [Diploptera punctata]